MSKTLPLSEVKARLLELVTGVTERKEKVVITRNGKPTAVLLNYDEYERLKKTLDVLSDRRLMKQIRASDTSRGAARASLLKRCSASLFTRRENARGRGRDGFRYLR